MSRLLAGLGMALSVGAVAWWRLGITPAALYMAGLVFGTLLGILYVRECLDAVDEAWAKASGWRL